MEPFVFFFKKIGERGCGWELRLGEWGRMRNYFFFLLRQMQRQKKRGLI